MREEGAAMEDFRAALRGPARGLERPAAGRLRRLGGTRNNALFGAQAAYDELVPGFEALFEREGRDWPRFYAAVKRLAALPKDERMLALRTGDAMAPRPAGRPKNPANTADREGLVPDIHIERSHQLGLEAARAIARKWVGQAEQDYGLACSYEEGQTRDIGRFSRAGIDGSVEVSADSFTLRATLGGLFGGFSGQIEERLRQKLDNLLGRPGDEGDDDALQRQGLALKAAAGAQRATTRSGRCTPAWPRPRSGPCGRSRRPTWRARRCR